MGTLPSIHVVHPGGYLQCASYLIRGAEGAVLIDPGSGSLEGELIDGLHKAGVSPEEVPYALLTHCHVDHARGAYRFRDRGTRLVASPRTGEILQCGGHQVWYEYPDHVIPTEVDLTPADGDVLELCGLEITVVHTPGHTDGCVSYLAEAAEGRTVFSGDLVNSRGHPGWAGSEGFSVEATLASIEKLVGCAPARAYWGHGPVAGDATDWLREAARLGRSGQWQLPRERHPDVRPPASFERDRP